jgi:hypothetical protein
MKPLVYEDIPALASLVSWTTHRKVAIFYGSRFDRVGKDTPVGFNVIRNHVVIATVVIENGKALATDIISGFDMRSCHKQDSWPWEIVI